MAAKKKAGTKKTAGKKPATKKPATKKAPGKKKAAKKPMPSAEIDSEKLISAAKDMNKALGLQPAIDTSPEKVKAGIIKNAEEVHPSDKLKKSTRAVLQLLTKTTATATAKGKAPAPKKAATKKPAASTSSDAAPRVDCGAGAYGARAGTSAAFIENRLEEGGLTRKELIKEVAAANIVAHPASRVAWMLDNLRNKKDTDFQPDADGVLVLGGKAATKKPATKKAATKKPATKKPATKKPATKKPAKKK